MTVVNVFDNDAETCATNVKNALLQYGTSFFDSFETDFTDTSNLKVKCKIGQNVALTFLTKRNNTSNFSLSFSDKDVLAPNSNPIAYEMYFLQKAIAIVCKASNDSSSDTYTRVIVIAKDTAGSINIFYRSANAVGNYYSEFPVSDSTVATCTVTINNDQSTSMLIIGTHFDHSYLSGTSKVVGYSIPCYDSGVSLDGVYITKNTDFATHYSPFQYTVNTQLYTGFASNCIVVKGT